MILDSSPILPIMTPVSRPQGTHSFYPNVYNSRLIVPLERHMRRVALEFFLPLRQRISAYMGTLEAKTLKLRENRYLQETQFMESLKTRIGDQTFKTAVSIGTPGPYSKNTILFLNHQAEPCLLAKIANTQGAKTLLSNEVQWLKHLSTRENLRHSVPRFIADLRSDGTYVLVQSICQGNWTGRTLSSAHITFLATFQGMGEVSPKGCYTTSTMRNCMNKRLNHIQHRITPEWFSRLTHGLRLVECELQSERIIIVPAHRDFAPWNLKLHNNSVSAFDWEYASDGYLPLYDIFHFLLMPITLKHQIPFHRIPFLISQARNHGAFLGNADFKTCRADIQLLAYLLDVCLFYLESNQGRHQGDFVVTTFGRYIDAFEQWRNS
ncbi:MAG: phosphotransferase [Nitrospira sp.]|nr:phosphotransferase [Nitrospira sp.]